MKLSEINENYVHCALIELSEDGDFVQLREPTVGELDQMHKAKEEDRITELSKLFPLCLVDHSFSANDDDNKKASGKEVYGELQKSGTLFMEIISIWMESLPFNKRLKKEEK
jgi:hypothetical protein